MQPVDSIPVGDLLQRVAADASRKVLSMLEAMPAQTPELRFEKMKACMARLKKQLCQLLALLMWLRDNNVQKYLTSVRALGADVRQRQMQLDGVQDAFYYLHQSIYKRRRQALDVFFATDIIARGTYAHLPSSIFDFGGASSDMSGIPKLERAAELDMFIGCKLCLSDPISGKFDSVHVEAGQLHLRKSNSFNIALTLSAASEMAHWVVVEVEFTMEHREGEGFVDSYAHAELEKNVKTALNTLLRHKGDSAAGNMAADRSVLDTVSSLCRHVAMSLCLKLLYIQATYNSRYLSEGYSLSMYSEMEDSFVLEYSFWAHAKGRSHGYPYMLKLSLPRDVKEEVIHVDVYRILQPSTQGNAPVLIDMGIVAERRAAISAALSSSGASFPDALLMVQSICAEERLKFVYDLMNRCQLFKYSREEFSVELDCTGLSLVIRDGGRNFVRVSVCALTGKFIVTNTGISWEIIKGAKECLDQFVAELNGIIMDWNVKKIKSFDEAMVRFSGFEFQTVSRLLRYFLLFDDHNDFELLYGTTSSIPVQWMDRLVRCAELGDVVSSMYTISRTAEDCYNPSSKSMSNYETLVVFVIAMDSGMKKSFYIISSCVGIRKDSVPVFCEIHKYSDEFANASINSSLLKQSPLLTLLRRQDLVAYVSICGFIAALCRVRVCLCIEASSEKLEEVLQRLRLSMKGVTVFSNINEYLSASRISLCSNPLFKFLQVDYVHAANSLDEWCVSSAFGGDISCAVHKTSNFVLFFVNIQTCGVKIGDHDPIDDAIDAFGKFEVSYPVSTAVSRALIQREIRNSPASESCFDIVPPIYVTGETVDADLYNGKYLIASAGSSCSGAYLMLRCCCRDIKTLQRIITSPQIKERTIAIGGLGCVILEAMRPLNFAISFKASAADLPFCKVHFSYRAMSDVAHVLAHEDQVSAFDLSCSFCECHTDVAQFPSCANFLGLCRRLISFSLENFAVLVKSASTKDELIDGLSRVAIECFPAALLSWRAINEHKAISKDNRSHLRLDFCNALSPHSFSAVLSAAPPERDVISFCNIDIIRSSRGDAAETWVYKVLCRSGVFSSDNNKTFSSADPAAIARYILGRDCSIAAVV